MTAEFSHTSSQSRVVVAGGGLAGLTAAAHLARAGVAVQLYERADALGGRARTTERQGFLLNLGPHALYAGGPGARVLDGLGISWSGSAPPEAGNFLTAGAERWPLPVRPLALLRHEPLSWRERLQALRFFARLPRLDTEELARVSLDSFLAQQGLSEPVAKRIRALLRLTSYCPDSAEVSAGAVLPQLQQAADQGVVYLDGGWQTLVDGLAECARGAGATLHTRKGVQSVTPGGGSQGVTPGGGGQGVTPGAGGLEVTLDDGERVAADAVVLALPPGAAREALGEHAGSSLTRFADSARPVRAACLDVGLAHLPRPDISFGLDIEEPLYMSLHSASARLAPDGGHLIHLARYGGDPDGTARETLSSWLDALQPDWRRHAVVQRYLPGSPVMNDLPRAADGGLAGRPDPADSGCTGVYICGDWVGSVGLLSDASFASAREAARRITERTAIAA